MGNRIVAQAGISGQDLGKEIDRFTNGTGEEIDELPDGIWIANGVVSWRTNDASTSEAA